MTHTILQDSPSAQETDGGVRPCRYKIIGDSCLDLTEELRNAYAVAKEYDFRFAERQATKEIIDGLGSAYQSFLDGYAAALDSYQKAIEAVEQAARDCARRIGLTT